jgi:hypothetical protein
MHVIRSFEELLPIYKTTWGHIPEDAKLTTVHNWSKTIGRLNKCVLLNNRMAVLNDQQLRAEFKNSEAEYIY